MDTVSRNDTDEAQSTEETIELHSYGDRELWYAEAVDKTWSLPVFVLWKLDAEHKEHYGLVVPACAMYTSQYLQLIALLQFHDIGRRKDRWVLPRKMIEILLFKAPGITIEYYYRWPDRKMPFIPVTPTNIKQDFMNPKPVETSNAFLAHVCQQYGLPSSVVRVVMRAVCQEAPKWLLWKRRPIDLGFCRLVAFPFRPNWKEIMAAKFRHWNLLSIFKGTQKEKAEALYKAGIPGALCSVQNIGLRKEKDSYQIEYSLEVIPSKKFQEEVNRVEAKRQTCGQTSYVASFEKTVESLYTTAMDALEAYLHQVRRPFAKICERGDSGVMRFAPTFLRKVRVGSLRVRDLPVHIVAPSAAFSVFEEARGGQNLVCPAPPPMPEVPAVLPAPDDVREPNGSTTDGMLLHDVVESQNEGGSMLSEPTAGGGHSSGVDAT